MGNVVISNVGLVELVGWLGLGEPKVLICFEAAHTGRAQGKWLGHENQVIATTPLNPCRCIFSGSKIK